MIYVVRTALLINLSINTRAIPALERRRKMKLQPNHTLFASEIWTLGFGTGPESPIVTST
jgi:hypothetical protein